MPERFKGSHPEQPPKHELVLRDGLNAVVMPELQDRDADLYLQPVSAEETAKRLQDFLDEIQRQGGKIVSTMSVPAIRQIWIPEHNVYNGRVEQITIFIVEK